MQWIRLAVAGLLVAALVSVVARSSEQASAYPAQAPCSVEALAGAFHGADAVDSVQSYGCVGSYAYLWATIGQSEEEIGVTEIVGYDANSGTWQPLSRLRYCSDHRLPAYVALMGCHSN